MWCAVRARANTSHIPPAGSTGGPVAGAHVSPYNAAASVNMAIWLSFEVWLANTYVAERPYHKLSTLMDEVGSALFDRNISFPRSFFRFSFR